MNAVPKETAKDAARRLAVGALREGYKATALHVYCDASGDPLFWRMRCKHPDGRKWMRPMHWNGVQYVLGDPPKPAEGAPLYRLPELLAADHAGVVLIVEGEGKADALAALGATVTTSGSASSASGADWTPLRGRHCLLWPDHDKPGKEYADTVTATLRALGCTVERLDVEALDLQPRAMPWTGWPRIRAPRWWTCWPCRFLK